MQLTAWPVLALTSWDMSSYQELEERDPKEPKPTWISGLNSLSLQNMMRPRVKPKRHQFTFKEDWVSPIYHQRGVAHLMEIITQWACIDSFP